MKIVIIDNYDSFTYNLVHLVENITGKYPTVYRNNEIAVEAINKYDLIMLSPGPGIPDEMKEEIFKEGVKDQETGRTGLGLFLVKTLIERYGGKIWVEDNEPEGSVFVLRFRSADNLYDS